MIPANTPNHVLKNVKTRSTTLPAPARLRS